MDQPEQLWIDSVGKLLSDSTVGGKDPDSPPAPSHSLFKNNWMLSPESRLLYYSSASGISLYCNGHSYQLPNSDPVIEFIQNLCESRILSAASIAACRMQKPLVDTLVELEKIGALVLAEK